MVRIGRIAIGNGSPIAIQSMTNTLTTQIDATIAQIERLTEAGCDIVRLAIPDRRACSAFAQIRQALPQIPMVADIHYRYELALAAIDAGADKIRINPGNIGSQSHFKKIIQKAKSAGIAMRIGVNAGSLDKNIAKTTANLTDALLESTLASVAICQELDFHDLVISIKASDVRNTITCYREIAERVDYPLHLGVTEAGLERTATVKSAIALGMLLMEGIGDTIRVSITGDPIVEVQVAWEILKALELRRRGVEIVSCPTCGRTQGNLIELASEIESRLAQVSQPMKIAVMGCSINGVGEAGMADLAIIAAGDDQVLLYESGKLVSRQTRARIIDELMNKVQQWQNY